MLSELDVINEMLSTMGESPLNEIDEDHPLVSSGLRKLRIVNSREQNKGWWFNEDLVKLLPDPVTGYVYVPDDTINVRPFSPWQHLSQRGSLLFDTHRADGFTIGRYVVAKLRRCIPFDDLPPNAQDYVSLCAQLEFQNDFDADERKVARLEKSKGQAWALLRADDIRNRGVNLLYTNTNMAAMNTVGMTGSLNAMAGVYFGPSAPAAIVPGNPGTGPNPGDPGDIGAVPDYVGIFQGAVVD